MNVLTWLLTLPSALLKYAQILFLPVSLGPFYDVADVTSLNVMGMALPLVLVVGVAAILWWMAKASLVGQLAGAWLLLALLPVLYLPAFPRGETVHDRYVYLPSAGFCILVALAAERIPVALSPTWKRGLFEVLAPASAALAAALAIFTFFQLSPWMDNLSLYTRGVEAAPRNNLAVNNLAIELMDRNDLARASDLLAGVLQRDPNYWLAVFNTGVLRMRKGDTPGAVVAFRYASQLNPRDADTFALLARCLFRTGQKDEAIAAIQKAIALAPRTPNYHLALGIMLRDAGRTAEAAAALRQELMINPGQQVARQLLAELEHAPPPSQTPSLPAKH